MTKDADLKHRQDCAAVVEERLLTVLLQFEPCQILKVADVKAIAAYARRIAFDAHDPDDI